jgi:hypothetical protein
MDKRGVRTERDYSLALKELDNILRDNAHYNSAYSPAAALGYRVIADNIMDYYRKLNPPRTDRERAEEEEADRIHTNSRRYVANQIVNGDTIVEPLTGNEVRFSPITELTAANDAFDTLVSDPSLRPLVRYYALQVNKKGFWRFNLKDNPRIMMGYILAENPSILDMPYVPIGRTTIDPRSFRPDPLSPRPPSGFRPPPPPYQDGVEDTYRAALPPPPSPPAYFSPPPGLSPPPTPTPAYFGPPSPSPPPPPEMSRSEAKRAAKLAGLPPPPLPPARLPPLIRDKIAKFTTQAQGNQYIKERQEKVIQKVQATQEAEDYYNSLPEDSPEKGSALRVFKIKRDALKSAEVETESIIRTIEERLGSLR